MIDSNDVLNLLRDPTAENIICRELELRPQNLALFIAALSNLSFDYGYIVIGARKNAKTFTLNGFAADFKTKEPIEKTMELLSNKPKIECERILVEGISVFVVKVYAFNNDVFLKPLKDDATFIELFIRNLYLACIKLQSRKIFSEATEDERNDFIVDLLATSGYFIKDQSRRGISPKGKASGEVDILVEKDSVPVTIIEALNLDHLNKAYLGMHLDKIYSYDTSGNAFNVCLSYVEVKDFGAFWDKYRDFVKTRTYPVTLIASDENADKGYFNSEIRFMTTTHNRSGRETLLYHICVRIKN